MSRRISALKLRQWLTEWGKYDFDPQHHRKRPEEHVFLFAMSAITLRTLSGVYRRKRDDGATEGLQRKHDPRRSEVIRDFVRYGYPYSTFKPSQRGGDVESLKKPGWLPTAIVVNILGAADLRRNKQVAPQDLVKVVDGQHGAQIEIPFEDEGAGWSPLGLEPIEVIDGQHRLWAFDEDAGPERLPGDFELPVVAFNGLDVGWQAYLFWSINVSPKKINPSHAFDLFPLLRSEAWLETLSEIRIYREARAQELTELMFSHPGSPWFRRINMLGENSASAPPRAGVTQAGWVRALMSTYLSPGQGNATSGLFGASVSTASGPLEWSRPQQAAFLIRLWTGIRTAVIEGDHDWKASLRPAQAGTLKNETDTSAFDGKYTMLNQEQGLRGVLWATNEAFFQRARLNPVEFSWSTTAPVGAATSVEDVDAELANFVSPITEVIDALAERLAGFDWRSADAPGLNEEQKLTKRAFRGSGGYVALREQIDRHLRAQDGKPNASRGDHVA